MCGSFGEWKHWFLETCKIWNLYCIDRKLLYSYPGGVLLSSLLVSIRVKLLDEYKRTNGDILLFCLCFRTVLRIALLLLRLVTLPMIYCLHKQISPFWDVYRPIGQAFVWNFDGCHWVTLNLKFFQNMWDLTPDTDLLKELPQEYTFETALADLIVSSLTHMRKWICY